MSKSYFDAGKFVMEQFHESKPFASFFARARGTQGNSDVDLLCQPGPRGLQLRGTG